MHKTTGKYKAVSVYLSLFVFLLLSSCMADSPDTELVNLSKELAQQSKAPVSSVGRDPSSISLSDRAYTYVNFDELKKQGKQPPYYLDLDIPFDTAEVWTQADIDCSGCNEQTKKERAKKWDLKINGRDISLNTNNIDKNGTTLQAVAATNLRAPLETFYQDINLEKQKILPQTKEPKPKITIANLTDGSALNTFGNSFMFRTTKGDRIIYFEIVEASMGWVLFNVREQILGKDTAFKPARRLYIKWGKDAVGTGIMDVDEFGVIHAYFDFDACFNAQNEALCFAGNGDSALNSSIVASTPMPNWDAYVEIQIGGWKSGAFSINGGLSRDAKRNNEFDAAALYLGQIKGLGQLSYDKSMKELWGFSSMQEFWLNAEQQPEKYQQTNLGNDGINPFYTDIWYQVEQNSSIGSTQAKAVPNRRIYILETTKNEGLLFQVTDVDNLGNVKEIAYKGGKVKQPRQFKIKFRQTERTVINRKLNRSSSVPIFALDNEIVDAESGQPLIKEEFEKVKISIRRLFSNGGELETYKPKTITQDQATAMQRKTNVNGVEKTLQTPAGDYQAVFEVYSNGPCSMARANKDYEILARLPGEDMQVWQISTKVCYE